MITNNDEKTFVEKHKETQRSSAKVRIDGTEKREYSKAKIII